jgi:hypothetical protein
VTKAPIPSAPIADVVFQYIISFSPEGGALSFFSMARLDQEGERGAGMCACRRLSVRICWSEATAEVIVNLQGMQ